MGAFKENTEFVLGKVDSLFQLALPHLKNGAEEAIKYSLADAYVSAAWYPLLLLFSVILVFMVHRWLTAWEPKGSEGKDAREIFRFLVPIVVTLFIVPCGFAWWSSAKCAVKATVSPAVYTVLKLAGKDCKE